MNHFQIFLPMREKNTFKLLFPIQIIITHGLPKVQIIGNVTQNIKNQRWKIFSFLKLNKLLKMQQILIEFPTDENIVFANKGYIKTILDILYYNLKHKRIPLKRLELSPTHSNQNRNDAFYIHVKHILENNHNYIPMNIKNIRFIKNTTAPKINLIVSPLISRNITRIMGIITKAAPINKTIIKGKQALVNSIYNMDVPRIQVITDIPYTFLADFYSKFNFNTVNYIIIPTCTCEMLFSKYQCSCSKNNILKHLNKILNLLNVSTDELLFYNMQTNKINKLKSNNLVKLYEEIL